MVRINVDLNDEISIFSTGEWMSSIDALEWVFLTIAPTERDCPSVFFKTLLRSASFVPWILDIFVCIVSRGKKKKAR